MYKQGPNTAPTRLQPGPAHPRDDFSLSTLLNDLVSDLIVDELMIRAAKSISGSDPALERLSAPLAHRILRVELIPVARIAFLPGLEQGPGRERQRRAAGPRVLDRRAGLELLGERHLHPALGHVQSAARLGAEAALLGLILRGRLHVRVLALVCVVVGDAPVVPVFVRVAVLDSR